MRGLMTIHLPFPLALWVRVTIMRSCNDAANHRVWVTPIFVGPRLDRFSFHHHAGMPGDGVVERLDSIGIFFPQSSSSFGLKTESLELCTPISQMRTWNYLGSFYRSERTNICLDKSLSAPSRKVENCDTRCIDLRERCHDYLRVVNECSYGPYEQGSQ